MPSCEKAWKILEKSKKREQNEESWGGLTQKSIHSWDKGKTVPALEMGIQKPWNHTEGMLTWLCPDTKAE